MPVSSKGKARDEPLGEDLSPDHASVAAAPKRESKSVHQSMATIPRLISVVEIIKREHLKTLDGTLAEAGVLSGLHQYNELGDLAEEGHIEKSGDSEQERLETLARALHGRNQCVYLPVSFEILSLAQVDLVAA